MTGADPNPAWPVPVSQQVGFYPVEEPATIRRSLAFGCAAAAVYATLVPVNLLTLQFGSQLSAADWVYALIGTIFDLAIAAIIAIGAERRRPVVVAVLVAALLLDVIGFLDWTAVPQWLHTAQFGLQVTLFLAAWFLGHRRSLVPLVLAPVAGVVVVVVDLVADWAVHSLFAIAEMGGGIVLRATVSNVVETALTLGVVVGFAWLGYWLDQSLTSNRRGLRSYSDTDPRHFAPGPLG